MPEKGWLKVVLEKAKSEVESRPDWQRNRVREQVGSENQQEQAPLKQTAVASPSHNRIAD